MFVGTAQCDITPLPGCELVGFAMRPQPSTAVLDPLALRALYLENGSERLLWLQADLLALERSKVEDVRRCIQDSTGFPSSRVVISTTHTHSGPPTAHLTGAGEYDPGYVERLKGSMVRLAGEAMQAPEDCRLAIVEGRCTLGIERRSTQSPHTDPRVPAVGWRRPDGSYKAVLLNYAMHGVCMFSTEISADWPGETARSLAQALPGGPMVLVTTGACANINPPSVGVAPEQMRQWGRAVAVTVEPRLAQTPSDSAAEVLRFASRIVPLPLECWTLEEIENLARTNLADSPGLREFGRKYELAVGTWLETMQARVRRGEPPTADVELCLIQLGAIRFLTINAEVFSHFNAMVPSTESAPLYVIGCTNGMIGYLAPTSAYDENGYEVETSMFFYNVLRPKRGAMEWLAERAAELINAQPR